MGYNSSRLSCIFLQYIKLGIVIGNNAPIHIPFHNPVNNPSITYIEIPIVLGLSTNLSIFGLSTFESYL